MLICVYVERTCSISNSSVVVFQCFFQNTQVGKNTREWLVVQHYCCQPHHCQYMPCLARMMVRLLLFCECLCSWSTVLLLYCAPKLAVISEMLIQGWCLQILGVKSSSWGWGYMHHQGGRRLKSITSPCFPRIVSCCLLIVAFLLSRHGGACCWWKTALFLGTILYDNPS